MSLLVDLALWAIVVVLGLVAASRSQSLCIDALRGGARDFLQLLPRIAIGVIGSGYLAALLPQALIASWLGPHSGISGLALAAMAGALTPGGPVVGFALATTALKSGAGAPQVIAYIIAWALFALQRVVIFEIPTMPPHVVWLRVIVSLPLPFLAAWMAMVVGKP
jgi:uncharacterized membrane protein YraQ (UPF0718 family)